MTMIGNNFLSDEISVLSEEQVEVAAVPTSTSTSTPRSRPTATTGGNSMQSIDSGSLPNTKTSLPSASTTPTIGESVKSTVPSLSTLRKKLILPGKAFQKGRGRRHLHFGIDDISVTDSLCSGVLRDAAIASRRVKTKLLGGRESGATTSTSATNAATTTSSITNCDANSNSNLDENTNSVEEDFFTSPGIDSMNSIDSSIEDPPLFSDYHHCHNDDTPLRNDPTTTTQPPLTNSSAHNIISPSREEPPLVNSSANNVSLSREERKELVKGKLEKYKRNQKQLKLACTALEQQLVETTAKLREVDDNAARKIESLEIELRETRGGLERISSLSTREVADQSECIKTLGSKLVRQAHVIQKQKMAVSQYKMQLEAMAEEMAMQDERDSRLEEEMQALQAELEMMKASKTQLQTRLQGTLEELMDLRTEKELDSKYKVDLEFRLQQQEAMLDRLARDMAEKSRKISELEDEIEGKNWEVETMREKLKESEKVLEGVQSQLEDALKRTATTVTVSNNEGERENNDTATMKDESEKDDNNVNAYTATNSTRSPPIPTTTSSPSKSSPSPVRSSWKRILVPLPYQEDVLVTEENGILDDDDDDAHHESTQTFESQLNAKEAVISTLNETCQEHERTIQTLRSDMVKMSSTYKQDSYLKRKEIAKLKQQNAEYALKLRALEKAFKCVNATENMSVVGKKFHGHTTHGSETYGGSGGGNVSLHGTSTHSMGALKGNTHNKDPHIHHGKNNRLAAVKSRIGALYDFPSPRDIKKDAMIVQQANFFDGTSSSDQGSDLGGKGENPEEC